MCIGADVNATDKDGDTCLHMILRLIARGDAGKHELVDMFNTDHIPLVSPSYCHPEAVLRGKGNGERPWLAQFCPHGPTY